MYLQICNTQYYIIISALGFFFKYCLNFANFNVDILTKCIHIKKYVALVSKATVHRSEKAQGIFPCGSRTVNKSRKIEYTGDEVILPCNVRKFDGWTIKYSLAITWQNCENGCKKVWKLSIMIMFLNTETLLAELCAIRLICEGLNLDLELF